MRSFEEFSSFGTELFDFPTEIFRTDWLFDEGPLKVLRLIGIGIQTIADVFEDVFSYWADIFLLFLDWGFEIVDFA